MDSAVARKRTELAPVVLTHGALARRLGVCSDTVTRWRKMGMPAPRPGVSNRRRCLLYDVAACEAWVQATATARRYVGGRKTALPDPCAATITASIPRSLRRVLAIAAEEHDVSAAIIVREGLRRTLIRMGYDDPGPQRLPGLLPGHPFRQLVDR